MSDEETKHLKSTLIGLAQRREFLALEQYIDNLCRANTPPDVLDGAHALHFVVWTNQLHIVERRLIDYGCNPFYRDYNGDTTLHYGARGGNLEYLINIYSKLGDCMFNSINVHECNLLLTVCADTPDDNAQEILQLLEWLWFHGLSIESQDNQGKTPLIWAAQRSSLTVCQWLLSRGADLSHRDHMNRTAIHMACSSGKTDVVLFLCEKGGINMLDSTSNDDRKVNTPIALCWARGHLWLAMCLRRWAWWYRLTGHCTFLSNQYAWYALSLMIWNLFCTVIIVSRLVNLGSSHAYSIGFPQIIAIVIAMLCWLAAAKQNPGHVKPEKVVLPDQGRACTMRQKDGLTIFGMRRFPNNCPSSQELLRLECEAKRESMAIARLNRDYHQQYRERTRVSPNVESHVDRHVTRLQLIADEMGLLREDVARERRKTASSSEYANLVQSGKTNHGELCYTCHMMRAFRSHHCAECGACVNRFDHHCVWIDNCVGLRNQRSFLFFLYALTFALITNYALTAFHTIDFVYLNTDQDGRPDITTRSLLRLLGSAMFYISILNALVNLVWVGFAGILAIRTTRSMFTDVTYYESLRKAPHIVRRFGERRIKKGCWDFHGLTFKAAILNTWDFCAQSARRTKENYAPSRASHQALLAHSPPAAADRGAFGLAWKLANYGPGESSTSNNHHILGRANTHNFSQDPFALEY